MRNIYSNARSRQQMETFCWLGTLRVLQETVEEGAGVMWRKIEVGRLLRGVSGHQALLSEGVEPSWDGAQYTHQQNCQQQLQHSKIIFGETMTSPHHVKITFQFVSGQVRGGLILSSFLALWPLRAVILTTTNWQLSQAGTTTATTIESHSWVQLELQSSSTFGNGGLRGGEGG